MDTGLNGAAVIAYKDLIYVVSRAQNTDLISITHSHTRINDLGSDLR